jgi:hypothetical protein
MAYASPAFLFYVCDEYCCSTVSEDLTRDGREMSEEHERNPSKALL